MKTRAARSLFWRKWPLTIRTCRARAIISRRALEVAHEPKVVAWSHIYLGRIFDLQEDREAAMDHYRAAVTAGSALPEAKAAAELGLQKPYEPTRRSQ